MNLVKKLVSIGHAARNKANRKVRQPLREAAFSVSTASERNTVMAYRELLAEELNVKDVRLLDTATEAVQYSLKALPKQLGQKYGAKFPAIRKVVEEMEPNAAAEALIQLQNINVEVDDQSFELTPDEIEVRVEAHEGFSAVADGAYLAALVTDLDEELELEGLAREFVRRVQDLRKQADLNVDDAISVEYQASDRLAKAINTHRDYILAETVASVLDLNEAPKGSTSSEYNFDDEKLMLAVSLVDK
jgi:isoleucyl-tRNA synthetase